MARKLYEEASVQAIAAAIREKTGGTETYKIAQMAEAVRGISGSPIVDTDLENTTQFPQMNDTVAEFVTNVTYDPEDYTTTQVTNYYSRVTSYSKEEPKGLAMKLPGKRTSPYPMWTERGRSLHPDSMRSITLRR